MMGKRVVGGDGGERERLLLILLKLLLKLLKFMRRSTRVQPFLLQAPCIVNATVTKGIDGSFYI